MNLRALEAFYWINHLGSFQAAASRLNMTQPAISVRIRELERILNVKLFQRGGRTITLTAKGRELVAYAERVLFDVDMIYKQVGNSRSMAGLVRLGMGEVSALLWLPKMLKDLSNRAPGLIVDVDVDLTINLHEKLIKGEVDVGVMVGPISSLHLRVQELKKIPMVWAVAASWPEPIASITKETLAEMPIMSLTRDSHMHILIQDWFNQSGLRATRLYSCNHVTTIMRLVSEGFGAAILPLPLIENDDSIRPLAIEGPMNKLDFVSVVRRSDLSGPVGLLEDMIGDYCADR